MQTQLAGLLKNWKLLSPLPHMAILRPVEVGLRMASRGHQSTALVTLEVEPNLVQRGPGDLH